MITEEFKCRHCGGTGYFVIQDEHQEATITHECKPVKIRTSEGEGNGKKFMEVYPLYFIRLCGHDFFIRKGKDKGGFIMTEYLSGRRSCFSDSIGGLILKTKIIIKSIGEEKLKETVQKYIKEEGYANQPGTLKGE